MSKEVTARECRFAIHIPARYDKRPDVHLVKERLHYSDGSTEPNIRFVKDYKRKFYVTKPSARGHKQKKEWEHVDNLLEYTCTQSELRDHVARALDKTYSNDYLKQLSASPYLYGSDISSTSLIKKQYQDKYPDTRTPYSVCYMDTETTPGADGSQPLCMMSVLYEDKIITAVLRSLLPGVADLDRALRVAMEKYLPQYKDKLKYEVVLCDTRLDIVKTCMAKTHEWNPDIMAIWNMDFDVQRLIETCEQAGVDPKDVLSHPKVPPALRNCKYIQGKTKKISASGKVTPISPASRWHTLDLTAGFYVLDAMCVYKLLRLAEPEESSYSLDAILKKELKTQKLKFAEADHVKGVDWHLYMQEKHPIEYILYNWYDVLGMQELENKIRDLSMKVPEFAGCTDFSRFNSQPKKIVDALYGYLLPSGNIIGTVGYADEEITDEDGEWTSGGKDNTLSLKDWILTLPLDHQVRGLTLFTDNPTLQTNIRAMVYDSDAVSAYPTATEVCNISKETTERELIEIEGISEEMFRMQNINLMAGPVNSVEYGVTMHSLPRLQDLLEGYKRSRSF